MIDYDREVPCADHQGPKALEFSLNVFLQHGFSIVKKNTTGFELQGPGMVSSRQNPLLGISRLMCFLQGHHLILKAEFGGIRKLRKIMIFFLCALALFFVVLFTILLRDRPSFNWWLPLAPFLPWPFLLPIMVKVFFSRTRRALDVLIKNALAIAESEG